MIPQTSRRALEKLEKSVMEACGDRSLARRVRRDAEKGALSGGQALRNLEKAVAKRCGDTRFARKFRVAVEGEAQQAVPQAAPTKLGLKTLIAKNVVGWAREPGTNLAVLVTAGNGCLVHDENGKRITDRSIQIKYSYPTIVSKAEFEAHARDPDAGENVIKYMYQDSRGNVTIGIGHLIPNEAAARSLGAANFFFLRGEIHREMIEQNLADAFHAVRNATGTEAKDFETFTEIRITERAISNLFELDVDTKLKEIRALREFHDYSTYPPRAKLALLDMAFTTGATGTRDIFPKFTAAVRHRDWQEAARESNRDPGNADRNKIVRDWFLDAARKEPFFLGAPTRRPCSVMLKDLLEKAR